MPGTSLLGTFSSLLTQVGSDATLSSAENFAAQIKGLAITDIVTSGFAVRQHYQKITTQLSAAARPQAASRSLSTLTFEIGLTTHTLGISYQHRRNDEERNAVIGFSSAGRLLTVVHVEMEGEFIRMISCLACHSGRGSTL